MSNERMIITRADRIRKPLLKTQKPTESEWSEKGGTGGNGGNAGWLIGNGGNGGNGGLH